MLPAVQRGAHFAQQAFHATDCEAQVHGESGAQVLQHLVVFGRLVLDKELIDNHRRISQFAQAGGTLLQVFSPVGLVASGVFQSGRALLAACRRGDEKDHVFGIARGAPQG